LTSAGIQLLPLLAASAEQLLTEANAEDRDLLDQHGLVEGIHKPQAMKVLHGFVEMPDARQDEFVG
jgi:hypothetical protein